MIWLTSTPNKLPQLPCDVFYLFDIPEAAEMQFAELSPQPAPLCCL